jgi:NADH:ubiquinone oxidoreductase subunit 3 (subunit A)
MLNDIRTLLWIEWKRLKVEGAYWLQLIGFDPDSSLAYRIYVAIFWMFWVFTVWSFAVDQAYRISLALPSDTVQSLLGYAPEVILGLQLLYLVRVLRESPLKLSAPEVSYVATSPASRGAIGLIVIVRRLLVPILLFSLLSCLISMLLAWSTSPDGVGFIGLRSLLLTIPLAALSAVFAWTIALLKLRTQSRIVRLLFWLIPPLIGVAARLVPAVGLWVGTLWVTAVQTPLSGTVVVAVLAVLLTALVLFIWVGNGVHMAVVADDSAMFARLQRLGLFGRLYAGEVIARIQRQHRLARKKRLRLSMPEQGNEFSTLLSRMVLSWVRLLPGTMVRPILRGLMLASAMALTVSVSGWQTPQTWLIVLLTLIYSRPVELIAAFREDVSLPFVRQFLPLNPLVIFASGALLPILFMSIGALTPVLVQVPDYPLAAVLLVSLVVCALGLGQALENVVPRIVFHRYIPYEYTVFVAGILIIGTGVLFRSLMMGIVAAAVVVAVLALLLANSRS